MATKAPRVLPRTPNDDLADYYRSLDHGTPVVDPMRDGDDNEALGSIEDTDRVAPRAREVVITSDQGQESLRYTVERNDPIVQAVALKYAPIMSNPNTSAKVRGECHMKIVAEIGAAKDAAARLRETEVSSRAESVTDNPTLPFPEVPGVRITESPIRTVHADPPAAASPPAWAAFDVEGLGTHRARYAHIQISGDLLCLFAPLDDASGFFTPPARPVSVSVDGGPQRVPALYIGTYDFNGYAHLVMVINRPTDE